MSMFCHQCQEALGNKGCNAFAGVCGKTSKVANLQDLLVYTLKGVALFNQYARKAGIHQPKTDRLILDGLFSTITNANFDEDSIANRIENALRERESIKQALKHAGVFQDRPYPDYATWTGTRETFVRKSEEKQIGILATDDEDLRSLRSLVLFGLKGMAAYAEHALNLGYQNGLYTKHSA